MANSKRKRNAYKGYKRTFSFKDWLSCLTTVSIRARREYYRVTFVPKVIILGLIRASLWAFALYMVFYVLGSLVGG